MCYISAILLIFILFPISLSASTPKIIISEILRDPSGSESVINGGLSHEYIEITNISCDTFFIDSVFITDGSETDSVIPWKEPIVNHTQCIFGKNFLLPAQSALILDPDYETAVVKYPQSQYTICPGTLILTVKDTDLGNGLQSDDGIIIYKGTKTKISNVLFCAADEPWTSNSVPNSKIYLSNPKNIEATSLVPVSFLFNTIIFDQCSKGITPGYFELLQNGWFTEYKYDKPDTLLKKVNCTIRCIFAGVSDKLEHKWSLESGGLQLQKGIISKIHSEIEITTGVPLNSGDIFFVLDDSCKWLFDNTLTKASLTGLKISEIYPKSNTGETEWFEIHNTSRTSTINLQNWQFGSESETIRLTDNKTLLPPAEYLIICKDSSLFRKKYAGSIRLLQPPSWHTMDNYRDTLVLLTADTILMDKIIYDYKLLPGWVYQSLERITSDDDNGSAWKIALSESPGGPCKAATTTAKELRIGPTPFTPNNDGINDLLMICVPYRYGATYSVSIYSFNGKEIKTFPGIQQDICYWNGKKDNGENASVGPFFVVVQETFQNSTKLYRNKGILWR